MPTYDVRSGKVLVRIQVNRHQISKLTNKTANGFFTHAVERQDELKARISCSIR